MRALRHSVQIQRNTPTRSSRGAEVDVWATLATVLADVQPLAGREFYAAQQVNSEITYRVTMHHSDNVRAGDRLLWGSTVLEIVGPPINVGNRNRELQAACRVIND